MIFLKSFLISILILEGVLCSYSDFKANRIPNTVIVCGIICAVVGNVLYFSFSDRELILNFLLNAFFSILISFSMYALHIWAGGDVKLFILLSVLIPAEFLKQKAPLSIVTIFITIFSIAFIYLVVESIILAAKKEKGMCRNSLGFSAKATLSCMASVIAFQTILRIAFRDYYYDYISFFLLLNVLFVLVFGKIKFLSHKLSIMTCFFISGISVIISIVNKQYGVDIMSVLITLLVIYFKALAERFNYKEINTVDVTKGMVLSYGTVLEFSNSRVKGLPTFTTEDIATRITQEEADSIVRWAASKGGKEKITVLRMMPFAVFITAGFMIYLFFGVFIW